MALFNHLKHIRPVKIGIRAEDPARIWERRVPLTPEAVARLVESRLAKVEVVSSPKRIFPDKEYLQAGATLVPSLTDPDIVLGIKEPPLHEIDTLRSAPNASNQTHLMFSHTHKGQPYNTPLLARYVYSPYAHLLRPEEEGQRHMWKEGNMGWMKEIEEWESVIGSRVCPRLVDYELITNEKDGKRAVGFGWFAGVAGVLESLSSMAHTHLKMGYPTPFLFTPRPHTLPSLDNLRGALHDIGSLIAIDGTPNDLGPFIIGLTGNGQVSQGCLSMLAELPIEKVRVEDLETLMVRWKSSELDLRKIYLVHAQPEDYLVRIDGGKYDRTHYYQSPASYISVFAERIAPYLTLFLNGTGWSPSFPRLMTNEQLEVALTSVQAKGWGVRGRFGVVGDISCDVGGGLEFLSKATTLSEPTYTERPANLPSHLPSVEIMSVDILPASIPLDASKHFSDALTPFLDELVEFYAAPPGVRMPGREYLDQDEVEDKTKEKDDNGFELNEVDKFIREKELQRARRQRQRQREKERKQFPRVLDRATVAVGGHLRDDHAWLGKSVERFFEGVRDGKEGSPGAGNNTSDVVIDAATTTTGPVTTTAQSSSVDDWGLSTAPGTSGGRKKILILGSGMVAGPAVDLIAQNPNVDLVIASDSAVELQRLAGPHTSVKYRMIDAGKQGSYWTLIHAADVVISLLPASMHASIAAACIRANTHLITASYMSDDISRLDTKARDKDILILTEMGLDPGIDHCSAMDMLYRIGANQETVVSFTSFCGGLPVPEDSHVPLRYKFSWRPQGVLLAALNSAVYLLDKKVYEIPGNKLLQFYFPNLPISKDFELEGLPNRDSLAYKSYYRNPYNTHSGELQTFMRGTLRYPGFSSLMNSFAAIGLLDNKHTIELESWHSLVEQCLNIKRSQGIDTSLSSLIRPQDVEPLRDALEWLGLSQPSMKSQYNGTECITMPPIPQGQLTPLDLFAFLLSQKLKYTGNERDMVVLSHEIITKRQDAPSFWNEMVHTSTLIVTGTNTHGLGFVGARPASAMARTVGLPVAIAALLVADGKIKQRGVIRPTSPSVFRPMLDGLERVGISMKERTASKKTVKSVMGRTVEDALIEAPATRKFNNSTPGNMGDGEGRSERDLDGDKTWKEDEGLVVPPSSEF